MWLDWLFFKILTVAGWLISIWTLIIAYIWWADVKRERGLLNNLYYQYEKIRLRASATACDSTKTQTFVGSYQLFPVLLCEQRTVRLVSACLQQPKIDDSDCDSSSSASCGKPIKCKARLCPAPGSTPKFCVAEDGKSFSYWANPAINNFGAPCTQPFLVEICCPPSSPSMLLELEFESSGTYFQRCILHTVSPCCCPAALPCRCC